MDRFSSVETITKCECSQCGTTFNEEDVEYSIGDDVFCDMGCAEEFAVEHISDFISLILD